MSKIKKKCEKCAMKIQLSMPDIGDKERELVLKVLQTPSLSSGPKLREFEAKVAHYVGTKYAVAVNSGTSGLHLVVRAMGIREGDEVITTPFSFIASANCILFERAKPVFVDIDPKTLNIDVNQIEDVITRRTKAILAVDVFGHPADWDKLRELAEYYNLRLIEDSAEALGAEYQDRKAGSLGDAGIFGFYPNKQITTGEGGVTVTDNERIAKLCRSLRNQGRDEGSDWLEHKRLGYNYRLSDINCALGIAQLERINEILVKREKVAQMYNERLKEVEGIEIPYVASEVKISWFVYVVRLRSDYTRIGRDRILEGLRKRGIECRAYFSPIHLEPFYQKLFGYQKGDFPHAELASEQTIALPFYSNLGENEVSYVVGNFKEFLKKCPRVLHKFPGYHEPARDLRSDIKMRKEAKQKHILLVDDDDNVLAVLSDFLRSTGYAVCEARDAQGAMSAIKEEPPDLALIDLRMPGMNGINLMLYLKKERPYLPVIIYSGYPSMYSAIEAWRKGADDYIPKPFKLDELSTRIKETLHK